MDNPEKKIWTAPQLIDLDVINTESYITNPGSDGTDDFTGDPTGS